MFGVHTNEYGKMMMWWLEDLRNIKVSFFQSGKSIYFFCLYPEFPLAPKVLFGIVYDATLFANLNHFSGQNVTFSGSESG